MLLSRNSVSRDVLISLLIAVLPSLLFGLGFFYANHSMVLLFVLVILDFFLTLAISHLYFYADRHPKSVTLVIDYIYLSVGVLGIFLTIIDYNSKNYRDQEADLRDRARVEILLETNQFETIFSECVKKRGLSFDPCIKIHQWLKVSQSDAEKFALIKDWSGITAVLGDYELIKISINSANLSVGFESGLRNTYQEKQRLDLDAPILESQVVSYIKFFGWFFIASAAALRITKTSIEYHKLYI